MTQKCISPTNTSKTFSELIILPLLSSVTMAQRRWHKNILQKKYSKNKIEIGRFKGLGEMTAPQLKETTMNPNTRTLFKVTCSEINEAFEVSDRLMGRKPEHRFNFIQQQINQQGKTVLQELDI